MITRAWRVLVDALSPLPIVGNWSQPVAFALALLLGTGLAAKLEGIVPAIVVATGGAAVLALLAAYRYRSRLDVHETPKLVIEFEPDHQYCVQDQVGEHADGIKVRVWQIRRVRVRNLSMLAIQNVRLILEDCTPGTGDTYHRQLAKMHDLTHEYATIGFPISPRGVEYVDVVIQNQPDNGGALEFQYADPFAHGKSFPAGAYQLTIHATHSSGPAITVTARLGVDDLGRLTFKLQVPSTAGSTRATNAP